MGSISSNHSDNADEILLQVGLNIDYQLQVRQDLKQLLNWSLDEIRSIYAPFRSRKGSPVLNRSEFLRFINLSRVTSFFVYDCISKNEGLNVFEIVCMLSLGAYTSPNSKVQFLFNVFDLDSKKGLYSNQLLLAFKSITRGFCILTGQATPNNAQLEKYGQVMLATFDLNNDRCLRTNQIIAWLETSSEHYQIFKLFTPPVCGKEDYRMFNSYVAYSNEEISTITERVNKIHNRVKLNEADFMCLKPPIKFKQTSKENNFNSSQVAHWNDQSHQSAFKSMDFRATCRMATPKATYNQIMGRSIVKKKKFENIIIIKGKTITKKQVYDLREYFDSMSIGKKTILIEDFIQSFNNEKYSHMKSIASSLFNFLDRRQSGQIDFMDLVARLYPSLTKNHIETINFWNQEYSRNFNLDRKTKSSEQQEQKKKRVLPKTCIPRIQKLFTFFDQGAKGYVVREDLKAVLGNACSQQQIEYLFTISDADKDDKLTIKEFIHVLLPLDLQIEGLN